MICKAHTTVVVATTVSALLSSIQNSMTVECTKLKSFNFVTNTTTKLFAPLVEYSRHGVPAYLSHNFYVSKFLEIVFFLFHLGKLFLFNFQPHLKQDD